MANKPRKRIRIDWEWIWFLLPSMDDKVGIKKIIEEKVNSQIAEQQRKQSHGRNH